MNKSSFFTGQPIFTQLLKVFPRHLVFRVSLQHQSDRYYKKFDTYHHLVTMLYACFQQCTSLREITTGLRACEGRLQSLGVKYLTARTTLSEANKRRSYKVFEKIYYELYRRYSQFFSGQPFREDTNLIIIDSTTISLFKDIIQGHGPAKLSGKRKGGVKVHMAVRGQEDVPFFMDLTKGTQSDVSFLQKLCVPPKSVVVMDRAYNNFRKFNSWTNQKIDWVTRRRKENVFQIIGEHKLSEQQKEAGVVKDQSVMMGALNAAIQQVKCRLITYFDKDTNREFQFITNNFEWEPSKAADFYKKRWQIELLFKRLKQNMPLKYFLGDNENAIKIQIYCALIADLLVKTVLLPIKRKWAFSNITAVIRLHLMNYTHLKKFLENPDKCRITNPVPITPNSQLRLFSSA